MAWRQRGNTESTEHVLTELSRQIFALNTLNKIMTGRQEIDS